MDTAGGAYAWPVGSFCYCETSSSSGLSRCSCYENQLWPADVVMPLGLSVLPTSGTVGRFGVDVNEVCPPGTQRRDQMGSSECFYKPGAYVFAPKGLQGTSLAVTTPLLAAQSIPGTFVPPLPHTTSSHGNI